MATKIGGKIVSSKSKKALEDKNKSIKNDIGRNVYWFDGLMYDLWVGVIIGETEVNYKIKATLQHIYKNPNKISIELNMEKGDILFEKK